MLHPICRMLAGWKCAEWMLAGGCEGDLYMIDNLVFLMFHVAFGTLFYILLSTPDPADGGEKRGHKARLMREQLLQMARRNAQRRKNTAQRNMSPRDA